MITQLFSLYKLSEADFMRLIIHIRVRGISGALTLREPETFNERRGRH